MTDSKRPFDPKNVSDYGTPSAEFEAQGEPAVWCCFVWPELNRWQAIVAYESHRALVPQARALITQARTEYQGDTSPVDSLVLGDSLNGLAEMVLRQLGDAPKMGGLLMLASELCGYQYILAIVRREEGGSRLDIQEIPGVSSMVEARAFVDRHPLIRQAKSALLQELIKGPRQ